MKRKHYAPTPGSSLTNAQALIAGKVLDSINKSDGCIRPERLIAVSKPPSAPLHNQFTWDNNAAADKYRIIEAGSIIRSVRIVEEDIPIDEQPVIRAFVNVTAAHDETEFEGRAYIPMAKVERHENYRQQALNTAKSELILWKNRYQDLSDYFKGVFKAVEALK